MSQEESVPIPKLTAEELFYLERDVFSVHESHAAREICARLLVEYREMRDRQSRLVAALQDMIFLPPGHSKPLALQRKIRALFAELDERKDD